MLQRALARQLQGHFTGIFIDGHREDILAGVARHSVHLAVEDRERDVVFLPVHDGGQIIGLLGKCQAVAHVRHAVRAAVHVEQPRSIQRRSARAAVIYVLRAVAAEGLIHQQSRRGSRQVYLRPVVHHVHGDGRTAAVTVRIRHRHRQVMGDLRIRSGIALVVFRGVPVECVIEVQPARGRIIAGHGQGTFIRGNRVARERAVFKHGHVADDNGRHAVRGVDDQGSSGRDRSVGRAGSRAIGKAGFMDRHHFRSRIAIERSHSHAVIHPAIALIPGTGLHRICGQLHAAVEADVQTPQMVEAVQQVVAAVFVVAAATRGAAAGSGASGGHQVFTKGREEVLAADLHTFHLERRHLFLGIRGVEILQLNGSAILESQDEVVAAAGQRRGIRRKIKDEAPVRSAGDGLRGTSSRLGKTDIGHEGPPEKKWYLSKNR